MKGLQQTLSWLLRHPAVKGARIWALLRFARRQIGKRLGRSGLVVDIQGTRLRVPAWSHSAGSMMYAGLADYGPMQFCLRYLREGDLFADVGANVGIYAVLVGTQLPVRVIAFEPLPRALNELRRNVALNRGDIHVEPWAIGDLDGTGHLDLTNDLAHPDERGTADTMARLGDKGFAVPIRTLDSLSERPALAKVDVEGFETAVVRGAVKTLAEGTVLLIEVHPADQIEGTHQELWDALAATGHRMLDPERLEPVSPQAGTFVATRNVADTRRRVDGQLGMVLPVKVRLLATPHGKRPH